MKLAKTIMCAKCKRSVDSARIERIPHLHKFVFTVYCHGEEQSVTLGDYDLAHVHSIGTTEAFAEGDTQWALLT